MSEENKAVVRRFTEVFQTGDLSTLDEVLASNFVDHNPFPEQAPGREGMKQLIGMMRTTFPDMAVSTEDMIAEGDRVVSRWSATGTHKGEFMGVPATGNKVTVTGIGIDRIMDGKIVELETVRRHGDDAADRSDSEPLNRSARHTCEDGHSRRSYESPRLCSADKPTPSLRAPSSGLRCVYLPRKALRPSQGPKQTSLATTETAPDAGYVLRQISACPDRGRPDASPYP